VTGRSGRTGSGRFCRTRGWTGCGRFGGWTGSGLVRWRCTRSVTGRSGWAGSGRSGRTRGWNGCRRRCSRTVTGRSGRTGSGRFCRTRGWTGCGRSRWTRSWERCRRRCSRTKRAHFFIVGEILNGRPARVGAIEEAHQLPAGPHGVGLPLARVGTDHVVEVPVAGEVAVERGREAVRVESQERRRPAFDSKEGEVARPRRRVPRAGERRRRAADRRVDPRRVRGQDGVPGIRRVRVDFHAPRIPALQVDLVRVGLVHEAVRRRLDGPQGTREHEGLVGVSAPRFEPRAVAKPIDGEDCVVSLADTLRSAPDPPAGLAAQSLTILTSLAIDERERGQRRWGIVGGLANGGQSYDLDRKNRGVV